MDERFSITIDAFHRVCCIQQCLTIHNLSEFQFLSEQGSNYCNFTKLQQVPGLLLIRLKNQLKLLPNQ